MLASNTGISYTLYPLFTDAVPKEDFDKLKSDLTELQKKLEGVLSEKAQLEEDARQKSQALESVEAKRQELEDKISTLETDLDAATKDSDILNKKLLGKQYYL